MRHSRRGWSGSVSGEFSGDVAVIGRARPARKGLSWGPARHSPGAVGERLDTALPASPASSAHTQARPPRDPLASEEPRAPRSSCPCFRRAVFRGIIHLRLTHNFPGVFTRDTRKCAVRLAHGACVRGQRKAEPWALCPQHTPEIFAVGLHLPCAAPQIAFLGSP